MSRKWSNQTYRDEAADGGEGAGYKVADADSLEELYADPPADVNERAETPPAAPVEPAAPAPATPAAPVAPAVPEPAAAPQPVTPAVQPSAPVAPVTPPVAAPVAAPPVEPQAPVEPVQPVAPQETEAQRNERLTTERVKLTGELERLYAIPEAELESYRESPETYLPKLAAKLHVEVLTAVANGIYAQMPALVQGVLQQQTQQKTYEEQFFTRWSKLNTPDLRPKVLEMVSRYRQMNPTASFETLREEVGAMAHVRYRVPYEEQQPQAPAAAPVTTPVTPARPFVPAGAGGASAPAAPADTNPFTQLANEFLADGQHGF